MLVLGVQPACISHSAGPSYSTSPKSSAARTERVFLDAEPARPPPSGRVAIAPVVSLREPVGAQAVGKFVEEFLDTWRRESLDGLESMVSQSSDAASMDEPDRGRAALIESWAQRLKAHAHQYARLEGELVQRERIRYWEVDELEAMRAWFSKAKMKGGDVCVWAPLKPPADNAERLFANAMVLVLRPEQGGLRLVGYGETDEPPPSGWLSAAQVGK